MPSPTASASRVLVDPALSSPREQLLHHEGIAALLKDAWFRRDQEVEILWPEVDFAGYDVVVSCDDIHPPGAAEVVERPGQGGEPEVERVARSGTVPGLLIGKVSRARVFGGLPR